MGILARESRLIVKRNSVQGMPEFRAGFAYLEGTFQDVDGLLGVQGYMERHVTGSVGPEIMARDPIYINIGPSDKEILEGYRKYIIRVFELSGEGDRLL